MPDLIAVHVSEYTETLATAVSRDLVERFETATQAFRDVESELLAHIEANGLELSEDEPPEGS